MYNLTITPTLTAAPDFEQAELCQALRMSLFDILKAAPETGDYSFSGHEITLKNRLFVFPGNRGVNTFRTAANTELTPEYLRRLVYAFMQLAYWTNNPAFGKFVTDRREFWYELQTARGVDLSIGFAEHVDDLFGFYKDVEHVSRNYGPLGEEEFYYVNEYITSGHESGEGMAWMDEEKDFAKCLAFDSAMGKYKIVEQNGLIVF